MPGAPALLEDLLGAPGPSGYEGPASEVWRRAASFATLTTDGLGSSVARIGEDGAKPLLAVVGHIDEIGLVVTHVDEKGFLYFAPIGGWDPQILVGQRVEVQGSNGAVPGVAGRKPIHLLQEEQRKKVVELREMLEALVAETTRDAEGRITIVCSTSLAALALRELLYEAGRNERLFEVIALKIDIGIDLVRDTIVAFVALKAHIMRRCPNPKGLAVYIKGRFPDT